MDFGRLMTGPFLHGHAPGGNRVARFDGPLQRSQTTHINGPHIEQDLRRSGHVGGLIIMSHRELELSFLATGIDFETAVAESNSSRLPWIGFAPPDVWWLGVNH